MAETNDRRPWAAEEDALLCKLSKEGRSRCQIAKILKRSESSVYRRADIVLNPKKERPCMCCGKVFTSGGSHNRLCNTCRNKSFSPYAH